MTAVETKSTETIGIERIMEMIPHRYPILMVDRVVEVVPYESAVGIKNVSVNDPVFQGHFPGRPVMPGVLLIESMAQTAAVLVVHSLGPEAEGKLVYFMSVEEAKFRKPVTPGDSVRIHVAQKHHRGAAWKFEGRAMVDGIVYAEAIFSAMILDEKAGAA